MEMVLVDSIVLAMGMPLMRLINELVNVFVRYPFG